MFARDIVEVRGFGMGTGSGALWPDIATSFRESQVEDAQVQLLST